jgi:hypothetical protein
MPGSAIDPISNKKAVIDQLLTQNAFALEEGTKVNHVRWLTTAPVGKKASAIIVEFITPYAANRAVDTGTI